MIQFYIDDIIKTALLEDINYIDMAADDSMISTARYIAKASGTLCGIDVALRVFELLGGFTFKKYKNDGDRLEKGDIIAELTGPTKNLLKGERTSLNLLQHMSGIATMTAGAVEQDLFQPPDLGGVVNSGFQKSSLLYR